MICNNCGRTIKDNAKFCGFCGSEVVFGGETASAPVSVKDEIKRHPYCAVLSAVCVFGIRTYTSVYSKPNYCSKRNRIPYCILRSN